VTAGKGSLDKIMGDIFISYAHEDRPAAERVAAALKRHGWAVWWDPDIAPGDVWDELIERKLAAASCVVVLWSGTSVHKQWVKAEASEAQARGILVPVLIEDVKPPSRSAKSRRRISPTGVANASTAASSSCSARSAGCWSRRRRPFFVVRDSPGVNLLSLTTGRPAT
jgi:hypothetical protein